MLGLEYLVAECWISPVITMLVNTVSKENKGFGTAAFLFISTLAGTVSTTLLNYFQTHYGAAEEGNGYMYGYILCAFVVFSYGGSVPFFILAGRSYKQVMLQRQAAGTDF